VQFGIFTVGDIAPDPVTGRTQSEAERLRDIVRMARRADELGLDVFELLATEVVPVLRRELAARRAPGVPDAPTHATLVRTKYGDVEPRPPQSADDVDFDTDLMRLATCGASRPAP
jgi:hypothetical protein